jgi:hypothetical protein
MQSPRTFGLLDRARGPSSRSARGAPGTSQDTKTPEAKKASGLLGALPKDTLFLVHVPSAGSLVEKGKRSPLYKLKDHPEVKGLLAKLASEIEKGTAGAKEKLGIDPARAPRLLPGE